MAEKKKQKSQLQMDMPDNEGIASKMDEQSDGSVNGSSIEVGKEAGEASGPKNLAEPSESDGHATSNAESDIEATDGDNLPGETIKGGDEESDVRVKGKTIGWEGNRVFILLTSFDLGKFEHWIRLGLIHPELGGADDDGPFQGVPEMRGAFPVASRPVPADVLIEVGLTAEEYSALVWDSNHELGWMVPGVLPIHRIQNVLFSSREALRNVAEVLMQGAVVPGALSSYLKVWSVQDAKVEPLSGDVFGRLNELSKQLPETSVIRERIEAWEGLYGQLSFLRSIDMVNDGFNMSVVGLNQLNKAFEGRWREFEQIYASASKGFAWSTSTWLYELLTFLDEARKYSKGDPDAPDVLSRFIKDDSMSSIKFEIVQLWLACDAWWGSRVAQNKALEGPLETILGWMQREDVLLESRTEALMVLSKRALRMNYDALGDSPLPARTRNFKLEKQEVVMTWSRGDAMNELMAECCWAVVNRKEFELEKWKDHLDEMDRDSILSESEGLILLFGMRFEKTQVTEPLYRFVRDSVNLQFQRANELKKDLEEQEHRHQKQIQELQSQLNSEREGRQSVREDFERFYSNIQKKLLG
jgi:hypothetical protein